MPDWLIAYLGEIQGGIVRSLATGLREGDLASLWLAFSLGSLHALTPGHGKAALAAYFLGKDASLFKGVRIALSAAGLHVISGLCAFLVLQLFLKQAPAITGRATPSFTALGYGLIMIAGLMMLYQSSRMSRASHDGAHTLTAGIGLLPCPLTISVLGFAWLQGTAPMVGLVLLALSLGIALTIGLVAAGAILGRRVLGVAVGAWLPNLERWTGALQAIAGTAIVAVSLYMLVGTIQ